MVEVKVKPNDSNQRITNFLRKTYTNLSLALIFKYIRNKYIKVNDKRVDNDYRMQEGDVVQLYLNTELLTKKTNSFSFKLASNKVDVVYEDDNILVVNKPLGVIVQDDESKTIDTLNARVQSYLYSSKKWDPNKENSFVPAAVHRLDRNTKGLIIFSKNAESSRILSQKIKDREIEKYYLARVHGIIDPKSGILHDFWTKNKNDLNMVTVSKKPLTSESKEMVTEYKMISHDAKTSLVEVHLITGRTHQIRAHLNFIGFPLVGETKYTKRDIDNYGFKYQDLTSYKIVFNFKSDAGKLNYLKGKEIKLK